MVIKSGPQKTFTLKFSTEEWNELRNLAEKIDAIYDMYKVVFYTWKTAEESAHHLFLSPMDCYLHAAQQNINMDQIDIQENKVEIPAKQIIIHHIFCWLIQKQVAMIGKHRCYGCSVEAPGQRDHMLGCLNEDKDYSFEFDLIVKKLYVYWTMVYEVCMQIEKKLNLPWNIQMRDCCLEFNDSIRRDIENDIVFEMCPDELLCLFEDCFQEI